MEPESADSPDAEEHAEEFSDVLEDLMDDVHERISSGQIPTTVISDSDSLEFADIIDENAIDTNNSERVENVLPDFDPSLFQDPPDESAGGFWKSPTGVFIQIFFVVVWFVTMW